MRLLAGLLLLDLDPGLNRLLNVGIKPSRLNVLVITGLCALALDECLPGLCDLCPALGDLLLGLGDLRRGLGERL